MNIYISYFYMVRFFAPYEIPLSTAVWDPKWFHDFKGQDYAFIDKRGVFNGVRATMFAPGDTCSSLCRGREGCQKTPETCDFLRLYAKQLERLDFHAFMKYLEQASTLFQEQLKLARPADFVLLVHEAPDNPCSERVPLQTWFEKNGHPLYEWERPE